MSNITLGLKRANILFDNNKKLFAWLVLFQIILSLVAFRNFWSDPVNASFQPYWDGQHSNFTYLSHLEQDKAKGFWLNQQQNYPYGDYIFYQDNPLTFTVPVKLISDYVYDLKPYKFAPYNFFHAIAALISTLFIFLVLKRFTSNAWLLLVGSLAFAWINPQILRLQVGHFSLAYSWVMTGGIYWLIRLYEAKENTTKWYVVLTAWVVIASFCHFYYLALLAAMLLPAQFVIDYYREGLSWNIPALKKLLMGSIKMAAVFLVSYLIIFGIIKMFDDYNHLRDSASTGYGWTPWKFNFSYLYSAYSFIKNPWLIRSTHTDYYESYAYLGGFTLFLGTLLLILRLVYKQALLPFSALLDGPYKPLWMGLFLSAMISFFISLGDSYQIMDGAYDIQNYFNPIRYLRKLSDMFTQFRCLGRFVWVWWWPVVLFSIVVVEKYRAESKHRWVVALMFGLTVFLILDAKDFIEMNNKQNHKDNIYSDELKAGITQRLSAYNPSQFQAILPLPYNHVGVSDMNYTIDGDMEQYSEMNAMSMVAELPLMSMQNARAVSAHNKALFSMFLQNEVSPELLERMNDKPVLVVIRKASLDGRGVAVRTYKPTPDKRPAHEVGLYGHHIVNRYPMERLGEDERYIYYRWYIKRDYKAIAGVPRFSAVAIEDIANKIRADENWLNATRQKSNEQGIGLDTMINVEAAYWLENF